LIWQLELYPNGVPGRAGTARAPHR
jgi:hypothetical protein